MADIDPDWSAEAQMAEVADVVMADVMQRVDKWVLSEINIMSNMASYVIHAKAKWFDYIWRGIVILAHSAEYWYIVRGQIYLGRIDFDYDGTIECAHDGYAHKHSDPAVRQCKIHLADPDCHDKLVEWINAIGYWNIRAMLKAAIKSWFKRWFTFKRAR